MKIIAPISVSEVQQHGAACDAKIVLGSFGMADVSPVEDFVCYRATFSDMDKNQLYLANCGFAEQTLNQTSLLVDIHPGRLSIEDRERVGVFLFGSTERRLEAVFLPEMPQLSVIVVAVDATHGPWTVIDGNHRCIAHYIRHTSTKGIPVLVCVHPEINQWLGIPAGARKRVVR